MASAFTSIFGNVQSGHAIQGAADDQINGILRALGIFNGATEGANKDIQGATNNANADLQSATEGAVGGVNTAVTNAQNGINTATATANGRLDPYSSAGSTAIQSLMTMLQDPSKFGPQTFDYNANSDPGTQFRMDQAQKALERSAAAKGGLFGGGQMLSLNKYIQGIASDEYGKAFDRFDRNRTASLNSTVAQMSGLSGVANTGLTASTRQGSNDMTAAQYVGDIGTQGAQWTGNATINTARYTGDRNVSTMNTVANNNLNNARFGAQGQMGIGDIQAGARLGRQAQKNAMLGTIGRTADQFIAGGFGADGGGFDWGGAFRGAAGMPRRTN